MSQSVVRNIIVAAASALVLVGCGSLPGLPNFGGGGDDASDEEKAGRIALTLDARELEADPNMASVAVILPDPDRYNRWSQSGGRASKATGHVEAANAFKIAWRANIADGTSRSGALTAPPVANENTLFVFDSDQTVRAVDLANGRRKWSERLRSDSRRDRSTVGGGIALAGDKVIAASGFGFVAAMDAETGAELWRRETGSPMTGSPTISGDRAFVASQNNEIFALSVTDGTILWSDQAIAETARVLGSPSPAAIEDILVAPYSSGEVIAYLANNGRRLWSDALSRAGGRFTPISELNDIAARPVLSEGLVFVSNQSGITAAIDGRSGQRVWSQTIGSVHAPALVGEFVFVSGNDGIVACLARTTGAVIWTKQLQRYEREKKRRGVITYAGPILASRRLLVVSSRGELIALSPQTGEETDRLRIGGKVFIEPIAVGDKIFVLDDSGRLTAVE